MTKRLLARIEVDPTVALSLAETIAWVTKHADPNDAGPTTRSNSLRPPWFEPFQPNVYPNLIQRLLTSPAEPRRALDHLVAQRRALVRKQQLWVPVPDGDLHGGRILCTHFDSDVCGASTDLSNGYLDLEDTPGWDTWFHHFDTGTYGGVVACWVPPALVDAAGRGAKLIPVKSAWWDDEARAARLFRPA